MTKYGNTVFSILVHDQKDLSEDNMDIDTMYETLIIGDSHEFIVRGEVIGRFTLLKKELKKDGVKCKFRWEDEDEEVM